MSRPFALLLGLLNVLPIACIAALIWRAMPLTPGLRREAVPFDDLLLLSIVDLVPVLVILNLFIAYRSNRVPDDKRMVWAIGLVMCNMIAFPIFWYQCVWQKESADAKTL